MLLVLVLSFSSFVFAAGSEISVGFVIDGKEAAVADYVSSVDYFYTFIWVVIVVLIIFLLLRKKKLLKRRISKKKKVSRKKRAKK